MHAHHLVLMIRASPLLKRLGFIGINLQKAIPVLSSAIKLSNLIKLTMSDCNIDDTALLHLGKGVCFNPHLRILNIPFNPYSEIGMLKFLSIFCNNGKISILMHLIIDNEVFYSLQESHQPSFDLALACIAWNRSGDKKRPVKYRSGLICIPEKSDMEFVEKHSPIGGLLCTKLGFDISTLKVFLQATGRRSQQF